MKQIINSLVVLLLFSFHLTASAAPSLPMHNDDITQPCLSCHQDEHQAWQQSDHAQAMTKATIGNVKGDFNQAEVSHHGQKALFYTENEQLKVKVSYDNTSTTYDVNYSFGHYPLQQYLVETEKGRFQILPFAWDARAKDEGGQRWYHNYANEEIRPEDRLHWMQPLQNWNGMCADCHSDGLVRNYDVEQDTFNTSWSGINVGCLSCHGDKNKSHQQPTKKSTNVLSANHPTGQWIKAIGDKTAKWHGEKRDNSFMDNCFACHSLRSPLTDGFTPNTAYLDQFSPQMLAAPMYHADGQIKEEVYVYGSFLQSKMYKAGVNCLDCHDKHTMKIKIQGNGLCLQCHDAQNYNDKKHVRHETDSAGSQCVNCHMPENRYMGVDDRRDHSFKIPRPDHSINYNTPNACTQCHSEKSNEWALENVNNWYGKAEPISNTLADYYQLHSGQAISLTQHLAIVSDENIDVLTRATALGILSYSTNELTTQHLSPYFSHKEPLLRIAAAASAVLLPLPERVNALAALMNDKIKAVRVAAARSLLDAQLTPTHATAFKQAFEELNYSNDLSSWRGEGRLNQAMNAMRSGNYPQAEKTLLKAIDVDPYMETVYVNLADYYRSAQKPSQVVSVLTKGMNKLPKSADLKYAYGLHLVRQQQYPKAITFFEKAVKLAPANEQYWYAYLLSLDGQGQTQLAMKKLQSIIHRFSNSQGLKQLGLSFAQKLGDRQAFERFRSL